MNDFVVRPVVEGERRAVYGVLNRSLHGGPLTDERWRLVSPSFPAERTFAAFVSDEPVGMASSFAAEIAVPGGKLLPVAAVDGVGVRPDHTRRGVITAVLTEQLRDCVRRGDLMAYLRASEATIYGRFGYGVATRGKTLRVATAKSAFRPEAPRGGRVRLLDGATAKARIPELYHRIGQYRPGMITRPEVWWPHYFDRNLEPEGDHLAAVHSGPDGDDGYVVYRVVDERVFGDPNAGSVLEVREMHAANPGALAGLWRYLVKVDLVGEVRARMRPVDEPIDLMLADSRAPEVVRLDDHTWLRPLDVPAMLAARSYAEGDPVVLEVADRLLPENAGRYRIGPDRAERTEDPAHLRLDVEVLAMLYLGEWQASVLADAGRIEVLDPGAPERADELFRVGVRPWCGTNF